MERIFRPIFCEQGRNLPCSISFEVIFLAFINSSDSIFYNGFLFNNNGRLPEFI